MAFVLEHTAKIALQLKELCRIKKLEYIGSIADKESHLRLGPIVKKDDFYYLATNSYHYSKNGKIVTVVTFQEFDYNPQKYILISDCPIVITVWNPNIKSESPMIRYAFLEDQLSLAKDIVGSAKYVDILFHNKNMRKESFLKK